MYVCIFHPLNVFLKLHTNVTTQNKTCIFLLIQEFSAENMRFWAACEAYKTLDANKRDRLTHLYKK
jgi:hypothetical protein